MDSWMALLASILLDGFTTNYNQKTPPRGQMGAFVLSLTHSRLLLVYA
jgi:hypothetical protein